jgi:hypothetical protein
VIGVAFQGLDGAENIGYVVPVTVVQHLLEDIRRHGKYTGFCSMGIGMSFLENQTFRKSLGMTEKELSGVMVREVAPTAATKDLLRPSDVILSVDGISLANDGKIPFRPGERVSLSCFIQTKFVGDTMRLQVLREEKELEMDVPVGILSRLVPTHYNNQPPPYMIVMGLVFTALSVPYLDAANAWGDYMSDNISYLLGKMNEPLEREYDEVVILAQVLAHRENLGYDKYSDLHLTKFNGEKVRSLNHLKRLLDECQETFLRFEFAPDGSRIVVLERSSMERVTREVCAEHSIRKSQVLHAQEEKNKVMTNGETLLEDDETKVIINGSVDF